MQCESRQASISKPWYYFVQTILSTSCASGNANSEKMSVDLEAASTRKKHSWEANVLWKNLLNHKKISNDDRDDSLSLKLVDCQEKLLDGEVCLLEDSPFRILRAAESGNVDDFSRLYFEDVSRLSVKDSRGRAPAHQAAARNRVHILQFIINHDGDLNIQDLSGNTPLHTAVENEALDAITFLLQQNVDTHILNNKQQAALHLATEQNKVKVLRIMAPFRNQFDPNQGGEYGRTALHIAAIYDFAECASILITDFGANTKQACNNGYYPIHEAAQNASSQVMVVLLKWGEKCDNTKDQMISFFDAEGNVPLHSAMYSGDFKAVELCLKSGAKISTQQHDMSTPVHLACSQGAIKIVKLMFSLQPDEKKKCLSSCDVQKMTPLHCAAMFNHWVLVKYLIEEGADINALDRENRSPLLLAAARRGWKTVEILIQHGADIHLRDSKFRNILHFIVTKGGNIEEFAEIIRRTQSFEKFEKLLNEKNYKGCAPLHNACKGGYIKSLDCLLKYGADVTIRNNDKETPLHLAAWYGRLNILKRLLKSEKGSFIINESNGEGLTALHIASKQGHTSIVQLLLNSGALLHRDHNGRNPLHLAAMSGYIKTLELLYSVHSHLLDQVDKDENTALHLAAMKNQPAVITLLLSLNCKLQPNAENLYAIDFAFLFKFPAVAFAMVMHETRSEEVMKLKSDKYLNVTLALIACMPEVLEIVLDKCITKTTCGNDSKAYCVKYDFTFLQCPAELDDASPVMLPRPVPLPALNAMVTHGRVDLLAHPLSQKYLEVKWNIYGKYFNLAYMLLYSIFLTVVTIFAASLTSNVKSSVSNHTRLSLGESDSKFSNHTSDEALASQRNPGMVFLAWFILVYVGGNVIRESIQFYQQSWAYLLGPTNIIYVLLYISTTILVVPTLSGHSTTTVQVSCASMTVFLSWFTFLLNLQRFDHVGIYVVMFLEMLQTLIKVFTVFSILIIAFGLAFYILLSGPPFNTQSNHIAFSNIPMSVIRTFAVMLGDLDFLGTYVFPYYSVTEDVKNISYPLSVFCILGIFMILMSILLINLLIGLAVGDIKSVKKNAKLKRLTMQVLMHSEIERRLPRMFLDKIDQKELTEYPNERKSRIRLLDFLFGMWSCHPSSEKSREPLQESEERIEDREILEMNKRLKKMTHTIERLTTGLNLIAEKMDIKTESEEIDDGVSSDEGMQEQTRRLQYYTKIKPTYRIKKDMSAVSESSV